MGILRYGREETKMIDDGNLFLEQKDDGEMITSEQCTTNQARVAGGGDDEVMMTDERDGG